MKVDELYDLTGKTAIVTGGEGLLGKHHCAAIRECGGTAISVDIEQAADVCCDITDPKAVDRLSAKIPRCDILINNAAFNGPALASDRLEHLPLENWRYGLNLGLTGAFIMTCVFGARMEREGGGVIINISSDLGLIAPDQRLYEAAAVKAAHYSVVKHGIIGLTRYCATYFREVRCNALCPGSVDRFLPEGMEFGSVEQNVTAALRKAAIPMGRLATPEEYKGAIAFLASDASGYMNGAVLAMDGGRTCW